MIEMGFNLEKWVTLKNGAKYKGALNREGEPHGFGIKKEGARTFYVGEFFQGRKEGRGFLLNYEEWTEDRLVWKQGTYEEVMETAVFDNCGRIIHVDNVGKHIPTQVNCERWFMANDGVWDDNAFKRIVSQSQLRSPVWKDAQTAITTHEYYKGHFNNRPTRFSKQIKYVHADGKYSFSHPAFVSVYDPLSIIVCTFYGDVFRLEAGKEVVLKDYNTTTTSKEHVYTFSMGKNYKNHVDLMRKAWNGTLPSNAPVHLYNRALNSLIFLCEVRNRPDLKEYADAISERMPEAKIQQTEWGSFIISLPDDEWRLNEDNNNAWLFSTKAEDSIRITGYEPKDLAEVAEQTSGLWTYIRQTIQQQKQ